jgi:hypothetical protein
LQELQSLLSTHMQQQQLAAMMQAVGPAAAAAFNPAMMMAGIGFLIMRKLNNIIKY